MKLEEYFEDKQGLGVLSTANGYGVVNSAVYTRPYFIEHDIIAFIMQNKRTLDNLRKNPFASYLFKENGDGYTGKRINLVKIDEEQDKNKIKSLNRKIRHNKNYDSVDRSIVYFKIQEIRPLIGEN